MSREKRKERVIYQDASAILAIQSENITQKGFQPKKKKSRYKKIAERVAFECMYKYGIKTNIAGFGTEIKVLIHLLATCGAVTDKNDDDLLVHQISTAIYKLKLRYITRCSSYDFNEIPRFLNSKRPDIERISRSNSIMESTFWRFMNKKKQTIRIF